MRAGPKGTVTADPLSFDGWPVSRARRRHRFISEYLITPRGKGAGDGPVFANRDGDWMSLANTRRALRAPLPEDLGWVTPHSFRRTVATAVRDALGPDTGENGSTMTTSPMSPMLATLGRAPSPRSPRHFRPRYASAGWCWMAR